MGRRGRRCTVPGCGRRVQSGAAVCRSHRGSTAGEVVRREVQELVSRVSDLAERDVSAVEAERFRRQLERGAFAALFAGRLEELLLGQGEVRDLQREVGAMRLTMARLLTEVEDPLKQAKAVIEVSEAIREALQAEATLDPGPGKHERLLRLIAQFRAEQQWEYLETPALEEGKGRLPTVEEREEAAEVALQEFVGQYWKRERDGRYIWDGPELDDGKWETELEQRRTSRERVW
jgi:hypothetical protein